MAEGFEVAGFDEIHEELVGAGRRERESRRERLAGAFEEADRLEEFLRSRGWVVRRVKVEVEGAPPVLRVPLDGVEAYIIVYPPRWHLLVEDFFDLLEWLLERFEEEGGGRYRVLVFYTRRGRLGLAAYLFLGFMIEKYGVGVLFVNGGPGEVHEVLETLKKEGRYVPGEEETVELEGV